MPYMCENYISATIPEYSFVTTLVIFQKYVKFNNISKKCVVKFGNRSALKLEKATKVSLTGFFSCYFSREVPHDQECIKTQAYGIKI